MKKSNILKREDGFTLIEIIAVLILLGILAAVAVPKYIDLQADAEEKAVQGIVLEATARANQYFAQYLLDNTTSNYEMTAADWVTDLQTSAGYIGDAAIATPDTTHITITYPSTRSYSITFTQGSATAPAEFAL
jgi:prepilin-type N-terminal cleavage/methylation domain-containing protein